MNSQPKDKMIKTAVDALLNFDQIDHRAVLLQVAQLDMATFRQVVESYKGVVPTTGITMVTETRYPCDDRMAKLSVDIFGDELKDNEIQVAVQEMADFINSVKAQIEAEDGGCDGNCDCDCAGPSSQEQADFALIMSCPIDCECQDFCAKQDLAKMQERFSGTQTGRDSSGTAATPTSVWVACCFGSPDVEGNSPAIVIGTYKTAKAGIEACGIYEAKNPTHSAYFFKRFDLL